MEVVPLVAGGPWQEPCRWLSPPPQRLYSLCGVLVFRPIVPDVRGGCDSTDNERNPSTDEVEPAGEREAAHCTLNPTGSPKDSAAFRVKVGVTARGSWPSSHQSEAAPASNREPLPRPGLSSPPLLPLLLAVRPCSPCTSSSRPPLTPSSLAVVLLQRRPRPGPSAMSSVRGMTWVSGLWVGAG